MIIIIKKAKFLEKIKKKMTVVFIIIFFYMKQEPINNKRLK